MDMQIINGLLFVSPAFDLRVVGDQAPPDEISIAGERYVLTAQFEQDEQDGAERQFSANYAHYVYADAGVVVRDYTPPNYAETRKQVEEFFSAPRAEESKSSANLFRVLYSGVGRFTTASFWSGA